MQWIFGTPKHRISYTAHEGEAFDLTGSSRMKLSTFIQLIVRLLVTIQDSCLLTTLDNATTALRKEFISKQTMVNIPRHGNNIDTVINLARTGTSRWYAGIKRERSLYAEELDYYEMICSIVKNTIAYEKSSACNGMEEKINLTSLQCVWD